MSAPAAVKALRSQCRRRNPQIKNEIFLISNVHFWARHNHNGTFSVEFLWFHEILTYFWVRKSIRIQETGIIGEVSSSYNESAQSGGVNFLFHSGIRKFLQITEVFHYVTVNLSFFHFNFVCFTN